MSTDIRELGMHRTRPGPHAAWAEDPSTAQTDSMSTEAMAEEWLVDVAPFGLLLGALFAGTHHRLLAPLVAHAALNTYWSALDAAKLREVADRERLQELLGGGA